MNNYDRTDVVFVIEKSISLKRYLPELLEAYISPTISCFGGGLSEDSDVFFNQSSLVQYGAVFYGTELSLLGSWGQVESFGPTCSEREIFSAINNACYTCKNLTRQAFILEGLQAAVNLFEKMKLHSPLSENIQRCCILITQSTPMSNPWSPVSAEKVLLEIKRIGIQLSIISAHKLVELYRLFDAAGGDYQANPAKNYASKPQHLVLLNGVTLQERALSPSLITTFVPVTNVATPPTTMSTAPAAVTVPPAAGPGPSPGPPGPGTTTPSPGTAAGSPAPQPAGMVRPQVPLVNQPPNAPPINPNPQPQVGRLRAPNVMGPNRPRWPVDTVVPGNAAGSSAWSGGASGRPVMIVNSNQPGLIQEGLPGKVQQPGIPNVDIPAGLPSIQQQQPLSGPNVPGAPCPGQGMNMNNQRTVVWQGTLEWQEKKIDNNSRVVHQVTCKMTSLNVNGEPEVKAEGWPATLIMQMIPKNILGSIGNMFFKNVKTVMFMPDQSPALEALTNSLIKGMAGCVHVSHQNNTQQSDVKVIILLFSGEKKAYVGFIPVDQLSFVNKIKTVIQSARTKQGQMNNPTMMPTVTGSNVTQPVQSLPGMIVNSNPNMQPIQTNTGTGMNVMSTQPQSMIIQQNPQLTQALGIGGGQQMPPLTVTQGMGQPGQGSVSVPLGNAGQNVLTNRPSLGMQQQQSDQEKMQILQIRQSQQQHTQAIRQQLQQQLQQRPGIANVSMNIGQQGSGANTCPSMGQPRMLQPSMQNPGLRQLLQQQVRLQQQQQVQQHQQQQQHPQQQQILMMQQQGIRPQPIQQAQPVLGQAINQQGMGQQPMGQQNLGQQTMNQQGIGQSIQDSTDYMVDLL